MDMESDMGDGDMDMLNFGKRSTIIHPPLHWAFPGRMNRVQKVEDAPSKEI